MALDSKQNSRLKFLVTLRIDLNTVLWKVSKTVGLKVWLVWHTPSYTSNDRHVFKLEIYQS